ncbi:MAG: DUF1998 domain-containing protein [bacterium]|nr:DUF1998 domain-containing protein [bacterium]
MSFTKHPQLEHGAVFFYDGYPGGVGIAECMYSSMEDLLECTAALIENCSCEEGCPSCTSHLNADRATDRSTSLDSTAIRLLLRVLTSYH